MNTRRLPQTLGELRASKDFSEARIATRSVKDELARESDRAA